MTGDQRRSAVLKLLEESDKPISATAIANKFSVTRQIIVSDVALLRASGAEIRALHRGYVLEKRESGRISKRIVCRHNEDQTADEFYAVVDNGGCVEDVIVEHDLYGEICAKLDISSRYEADEFMEASSQSKSAHLSILTDGLHIHTVSVKNTKSMDKIIEALTAKGIMVSD